MKRITLLASLLALTIAPARAADNYAATAGSGLTFAAKDNGSGVLFSRFIGCDNTTTTQCWSVNASGQLSITAASGSIASGAIASGAVASGAYASGAFASGAASSGSWADGAIVTIGTKADAATCATTNTLIACLRQLDADILAAATLQASATGGASETGNIVANNTTAVVIKASAGTLYGVQMYGIGSAPAYLKIYNATSATCGSGTPVWRGMIPAASTAANGAGSNVSFGDVGVAYGTGITYCVTTGIGDADTTAPAASTFLVNLQYK